MTTVMAGAGGVTAPGYAAPPSGQEAPDADSAGERSAEEVLFEADSVWRDYEDGPINAEGDVRAYFGDRYLRADKLIYDPATDIVIAEGNVSITDANLETAFAGRVELSGDLRDGIAENFSALLSENARLAAESAVREQGARTKLRNAVYTACDVCTKEGEGKTPTWRIKALRVTRDQERKVVRYHHAFLEIKGVPILYAPYLQTPDPSVERQSGFLPPNVGASSRLGFNIELPYYLAISNHQDATLFPKFTATDGVLWQAEWRRRGNHGYHVLSGGVIQDKNQNPDEDVPTTRWHIFGRGHRDFGDHWRASYDVERVSDDTYLRQYDVERRGDLRQELDRGRTNQLRSNARLTWRENNSHLTIDTYAFQGLRAVDDARTIPKILPLIDFRHEFKDEVAGGRASIGANFASLYRTGGVDSQRITTTANWDRDLVTRGGHRFHFFAEARADAYYYQDLDLGTEICSSATAACAADFPGFSTGDTKEWVSRLAPTAGVEWSYPLARDFHGARIFLEPRVQLIASMSDRNSSAIINEDSQSIEFDYAGLFDYNKATGFDSFEDGQRMNIGLTASAIFPNGISIEGAIGQQLRIQSTNAFDLTSGLGDKKSDLVGAFNVRFSDRFGVENRFRIDNNTGNIRRAETIAFYKDKRFQANASYVRLIDENTNYDPTMSNSDPIEIREELAARANVRLSHNWSVGGAWRVNLNADPIDPITNEPIIGVPGDSVVRTIRQDFTVGYRDECSTLAITLRRDRTRDANLEPDNAILLTFTLKSLVD